MWGPDAAPLPPNVALRWFSIAVAGFVSFGFLAKYALVPDRPAIPREYPFSGLVTELGGLEENQVSLPLRWPSNLLPSAAPFPVSSPSNMISIRC